MVKLDLKCRNLMVREHHLQDGDVRSIGRDATNHIAIEDPHVSRNHAGISRSGDRLFIWDKGSRHGTFINGLQVICGELGDGDLVSIGADYSLVVTISVTQKKDSSTAVCDARQGLAATT
jgi:pSer/pThr/pTyr-binding forkhead associated (FHA) protein